MPRARWMLGCWSLVAACGPAVGVLADGDSSESGAAETTTTSDVGESTSDETGEPMPPTADCESSPLDFATPRWEWGGDPVVPEWSGRDLEVLSGGDVLWLDDHSAVERRTATGAIAPAFDAAPGEVWSGLEIGPLDDVLVVGHFESNAAELLMVRMTPDGERVIERRYDDAPGDGQVPSSMHIGPTGDVFVVAYWLDEQSRHLQRYDAELERMWSVELPGKSFAEEIASDADGNTYHVTFDLSDGSEPLMYVWDVKIHRIDADGDSEEFASFVVEADNLPRFELEIGDRVYLLSSWAAPSELRAWDFDGTQAFSLSSADADTYRVMHSMRASACGGVYVGGRADVEGDATLAALWHVDANGVEGPRTAIVEELAGARYDSVDLLGVSALDEVIAAGSLASIGEQPAMQWMRGY